MAFWEMCDDDGRSKWMDILLAGGRRSPGRGRVVEGPVRETGREGKEREGRRRRRSASWLQASGRVLG